MWFITFTTHFDKHKLIICHAACEVTLNLEKNPTILVSERLYPNLLIPFSRQRNCEAVLEVTADGWWQIPD